MPKDKKFALGRGLDALLGSDDAPHETNADADAVHMIPLSLIDPNRAQPRTQFDEQALKELADSISVVGVIQPIIVRPVSGRYQIIAGERRFRAAHIAGLTEMPALLRDWDSVTRQEVALIENLQRDDLNPIDAARGVQSLMQAYGYTQEKVSERLGRSRSGIANLLRLLNLPEKVLDMVRSGALSAGHARALAAINDPDSCIRLANLCLAQGWSVRQLERICQKSAPKRKPAPTPRAPEALELEHIARNAFGTKAQLDGDLQRGKLVIHYYSSDDLQRIWDTLQSLESK